MFYSPCATIYGVAMVHGWVTGHRWRTDGRKIFRPYTFGAWLHWAGATICGAAMVMVGRFCINRARPGGKYFARTSMVWRRTAGARSKRVGDSASIAHARAKYFSPVHPWCGGGCAITTCGRLRINRARTGEKYFAPTHAARGYIGRAPRFGACRCLMVG